MHLITLLMVVVFTLVAVSQCQRRGLITNKLLFKGWISYDFKGGKLGGGIGAVLKFKRATDAIPHTYNVLVQAHQCLFDVYNENGDDIITLEEMTRLFDDKKIGANLFEDLHIFKDKPGVTKSVFNDRVSLVINGCKDKDALS